MEDKTLPTIDEENQESVLSLLRAFYDTSDAVNRFGEAIRLVQANTYTRKGKRRKVGTKAIARDNRTQKRRNKNKHAKNSRRKNR